MRDERIPDYHFPPTTERQRENTRRYMALKKEQDMKKSILQKISIYADKKVRRGAAEADVARALLQAGIEMMRDATGDELAEAIVRIEGDGSPSISTPTAGYECAIVPGDLNLAGMIDVLNTCHRQFFKYAEHHDAKLTEEGNEKGLVNHQFAEMCAKVLGNRLENPDFRPVERDSAVPAPSAAPPLVRTSLSPPDRAEILGWIDTKIAGAQKNDMSHTASVLLALRSEIEQHIEAAPIDYATALRAFYVDCHERNVKAGWWSDLVTGDPKKRSVGELFILFVTELTEAYDAYVSGEQDDKLPQHPGLGVELGDLQIRLADFCGALLAGRIVGPSGSYNPGEDCFEEVAEIARRYERIRKTPNAVGEPERGEPIDPQDVAAMTIEKLSYNATRADHQVENRKKEGGKQT